MINKFIVDGNLTRDPEMFGENQNVARFSIANNRRFGEKKTTSFFDCVAFGSTGEAIAKHFHKGKAILIVGRLEQEKWEDKEGNSRSGFKVVVEEFSFIGPKEEDSSGVAVSVGASEEKPLY